jgi:hypothetical protein
MVSKVESVNTSRHEIATRTLIVPGSETDYSHPQSGRGSLRVFRTSVHVIPFAMFDPMGERSTVFR